MRSLFYAAVVGLLGLVLSFKLAPLHLSKRLTFSPTICQRTAAKFQCRVAPTIQPTVCYSSQPGSDNLLSPQEENGDKIVKKVNTASEGKVVLKWMDSEVATLRELVTKQLQPVWSDAASAMVTPKKIDWISIGKELGRLPQKCQDKWKMIKFESKGAFSDEEDALILQRVEEWGDKASGLWTSLSEELHRSSAALRNRWLTLRMNAPKNIDWTEEMETALGNAYHTEKPRKKSDTSFLPLPYLWDRVSAQLAARGWVVGSVQCMSHYHSYVKYGMKERVWTPELVELLKEMRGQGKSWTDISAALNIVPVLLQTKWSNERRRLLKRGPYTPEEDALIIQRVTEWNELHNGTKAMGLWSALEKEMGRCSSNLRGRGLHTLSLKINTVKADPSMPVISADKSDQSQQFLNNDL